jgi:hypothetical protein
VHKLSPFPKVQQSLSTASPSPRVGLMEPYRSLALLAGSLGLISCLVALSTNFWFVAVGPNFSAHSGIWPTEHQDAVAGKGEWVVWGGVVIGEQTGVSSPISLHPCDTELLHSGCPVEPGVCGLPGPVLHSFIICPGSRSPDLNHHSLCCR